MIKSKKKRSKSFLILTLLIIALGITNYLLIDEKIQREKEISSIRKEYEEYEKLEEELEIMIKERDKLLEENNDLSIQLDKYKNQNDIEKKYGLIRLRDMDSRFVEELKYATEENFLQKAIYPKNSIAVLRKSTALKLKKANDIFNEKGYSIKIYDAYRPHSIQYIMWDHMPNTNFLANPENGSKHNRGAAVDITLVDKNGDEILMGTEFDNFTEKAAYNYSGHGEEALKNMKYLRDNMEKVGFKGISNEWWHFDDVDWKSYDILDISFDELN